MSLPRPTADYPFKTPGGTLAAWLGDQGFNDNQVFMFATPEIVNPEQLSSGDTFVTPHAELLLGRQVPKVEELFAFFHCTVKTDNGLTHPHTQYRGDTARLIIARNFAVEKPRTADDHSPYCAEFIGLVQFGQRVSPSVIAVLPELTA